MCCVILNWILHQKGETHRGVGETCLGLVGYLVTPYQCQCPSFDQVPCLWVIVTFGELGEVC